MLGKNFICGESLSVWWRGRNENKLGLEVTFGVKIAEERNDIIGVRQSRWTRLVSGLHKAWTPNPVCQFGARRINYHTKPLLFNQIVIKANLAMISASHVNAWSRQLDGPVPEQRTKLIYQIINLNQLVHVLFFVVCLHLVIWEPCKLVALVSHVVQVDLIRSEKVSDKLW